MRSPLIRTPTDTITDYARTRFVSFDDAPLCEVDSLILSWLSYTVIPWETDPALEPAHGWQEGIRIADLNRAEHFDGYYTGLWSEKSAIELIGVVAASPRFRDVAIVGYIAQADPEAEKQFAAMTFHLPGGVSYVGLRGTDSTLIGWKEDFNMSYRWPVPAQEAAAEYLREAAARTRGDLYVGGHSKGGNLAVYAASALADDLDDRIVAVFSHDGPGFLPEFLQTPGYRRISPKIDKTIPQSSVVGMLLEQQEEYRVVRATGASIWQHDPFSWLVDNDRFVHADDLTFDAKYLNTTVSAWLAERTNDERERFVDTLYEVIDSSEADTTSGFKADLRRNLAATAQAFNALDAETKDFIAQTVRELVALGAKTLPETISEDLHRIRLSLPVLRRGGETTAAE